MTPYQLLLETLRAKPRCWLVTGAAGFIGSHLLETLLAAGQHVTGLDNFSTGTPRNLDEVKARVSAEAWSRFHSMEGSVVDIGTCREATRGVDFVLHQAAFVSVPLSLQDPIACHDINVTGTLNVLVAARDRKVRRVVYASSSAVYGDSVRLPQAEEQTGHPLSPYGASKAMMETYARLFSEHYGLQSTGLRYFNVFGPRQNATGGYAAVIPQWIAALVEGVECRIHGDGSATRDFCPVANIVQANILASASEAAPPPGTVFNVALGEQTSLRDLYATLAKLSRTSREPVCGPERPGDILHSGASIERITRVLGYAPEVTFAAGLHETVSGVLELASRTPKRFPSPPSPPYTAP